MSLDALINRKSPSRLEVFLSAPIKTIAKLIYTNNIIPPTQRESASIAVVCVSDTHNTRPSLPSGDLLIHAGDLTQGGTIEELQHQLDWVNSQPHTHKVVIAGNHDILLDERRAPSPHDRTKVRWGSIVYLQNSSTTLRFPGGRSLCIYGSPWTRKHGNWAFQYEQGTDLFTQQVNDDVDVLVTHSPPKHHLDLADWGDEFLLQELWRVRPRLHVFGHIHGGHGQEDLVYNKVQRLYELICAGKAGTFSVASMAMQLFWDWIMGAKPVPRRTTLVNASAIGGFRDQLNNDIQVVYL